MGSDDESNLCLCCLRCNLKKGPNIASTDPEDQGEYRIVALFHPRARPNLRDGGRVRQSHVKVGDFYAGKAANRKPQPVTRGK